MNDEYKLQIIRTMMNTANLMGLSVDNPEQTLMAYDIVELSMMCNEMEKDYLATLGITPPLEAPEDSPYTILGLPVGSCIAEVKRSYKALANILHPDKETGDADAMKLLNKAYKEIKQMKEGE